MLLKTNTHQYDMIMTKPPPLNYHSLLAGRYLSPCTSLISVSVKWSRRGGWGGGGGGGGWVWGGGGVQALLQDWPMCMGSCGPQQVVHTGSRQIDCAPGQTPGVTCGVRRPPLIELRHIAHRAALSSLLLFFFFFFFTRESNCKLTIP